MPRRVLVTGYLSLATVSVLVAVLAVWNINQYRHLPVRIQNARKTLIRLRALVAMRCDVFHATMIAVVVGGLYSYITGLIQPSTTPVSEDDYHTWLRS